MVAINSHKRPLPPSTQYDPEPLIAPVPLLQAQQVTRPIRKTHGGRIRNRLVLEASSDDGVYTCAYVFDKPIAEQEYAGGALYIAFPVEPEGPETSCMVINDVNDKVVIKVMPKSGGNGPNAMNEVAAMQQLTLNNSGRHHHVITLVDCIEDDDNVYMVLPYLPGGDLFARVVGADGLGEEKARLYMKQMVEGLLFMKESCRIAHRDLSLENVMFDHQGRAKIIDMGICVKVPKGVDNDDDDDDEPVYLTPQSYAGKPGYSAPEVVNEESCDFFAADVWSLGVCLYMMLTGRYLYTSVESKTFKHLATSGGVERLLAHMESKGKLNLPPHAKDLICQMLNHDPINRPTLEQILHHPFLINNKLPTTTAPPAAAVEVLEGGSEPTTTTTSTTTGSSTSMMQTAKRMLSFTYGFAEVYLRPHYGTKSPYGKMFVFQSE